MMFLAVLPAPRRGSVSAPIVSRSDAQVSAEVNAITAADLPDALLIGATCLTPRSVSASRINNLAARVLTKVPAVSMVDSTSGFGTTPLRLVHCGFDALHRVVLGGHQA